MSNIIRIKRSGVSGNPNTLAAGELAYSAADASSVQGGDRLYIGFGTETNGNAAEHIVIGGEFFTSMLDHSKGTLTANSALIADSDSKLDNIKVDNLDLDGNTISSTNNDGDINIDPAGSGRTVAYNLHVNDGTETRSIQEYVEDISGGQIQGTSGVVSVNYDDPTGETTIDLVETGVTAGSYGSSTQIPTFTVDADGRLTVAGEASVATTLSVGGDTGSASIDLLNDTLTLVGDNSLSTGVDTSTDTVTITAANASTTSRGVASFNSSYFSVTSGEVTSKDITLGTTTLNLGSNVGNLEGLDLLTVDNIQINGNEISATNTDGLISLSPNGTGTVSVNDSKITDVNDPNDSKDAANKRYVDEVAQGLQTKPADDVATTENLDATYANGTTSATLTANVNGSFPSIDGYQLAVGETILVKDQNNLIENGSYELTDLGDSSNPWVLTRAEFMNETFEIPGAFEFIVNGTEYANTGWVATVPVDFELGSTDPSTDSGFTNKGDIVWVQFSGAGTFTAGDGLDLDGNEFNLVLAANSGLTISADELQVDSQIAGDGLSFSSGIINAVGTTDRITTTSNSIDIASTYAGQTSINTLGTVTTGTWESDIVEPTYGGTGVNNGSNTISLDGSLTVTGTNPLTLTTTSATDVTLPTTGTLATLAQAETFTNKTINDSDIGLSNPGTGAFTDLESVTLDVTSTDNATSSTTGAIVTAGGIGVAKSVFVGSDLVGSGVETSEIDGFTIDGGTY